MASGRDFFNVFVSFSLLFSQLQLPVYAALAAPAGPNVTAEMTAELLVDQNGNHRANPGDTLRYAVTVANSGNASATDLRFTDTLDPNTSLVPGSLRTSPLASDQSLTTTEETPLALVLTGAVAAGAPAAFAVTTPPAHGMLSGAAPNLTYTPAADYFGPDSFGYEACSSLGQPAPVCDRATIALTIAPVNDAPTFTRGPDQRVALNAGAVTVPGWATAISAGPANESSQTVTFELTGNTNPTIFAASPAITPDGTLRFTPAAGRSGSARITVQLRDDGGTANGGTDLSASQAFTVTVVPPPSAAGDSYLVPLNAARSVAAPGVLANDTLNEATIAAHTEPAHGTVALATDGAVTYTPATDYAGPDAFTYTLSNLAGVSIATVNLEVVPLPVSTSDSYQAATGVARAIGAAGVLANDTTNGASITAYDQTSEHGGAVALNADGSFTYSSAAGFTGADSFTYTLTNISGSATATVSLIVFAAPVTAGDSYEVAQGVARTIPAAGVLTNDTQNGATISGHTSPAHGSLALNPDGSFTYTPSAGFSGTDSFTYTLANYAGSDTATVSLTTYAPPVAANDAYPVARNTTRTVAAGSGVLHNDTSNGATISSFDATSERGGVVALSPDGSFSYSPPSDFDGDDAFTYTLTNYAGSVTATVGLTVFTTPAVGSDSYEIAENSARTISAPGVLGNDTPNRATISDHSIPAHGSVILNPDGSFTYTPNAGFSGDDSFTYTLANFAGSATATVSLTVYAPPVSVDDSYQVPLNAARAVVTPGVLANDSPNRATIVGYTSPRHGTLALSVDGSFTYTPNAGFSGDDDFTYTLVNYAGSAVAKVSLGVVAAPVAVDDSYEAATGTPKAVAATGVLWNDTTNGATITSYDRASVNGGTVVLNADGSLTYISAAGFTGSDSFTYTLTNISGSATATVSLIVFAAPVAAGDSYEVAQGIARTIPAAGVLTNDTQNGATISGHTSPAHGSLALNPDGSFTYTPSAGFSGTDSFTYTLTNPAGSSTATVSLRVFAPPAPQDDSYQIARDTARAIAAPGVLDNDVTGGSTISAHSEPTHGSLVLRPDGSFIYTPDLGFTGPDSFTYTLGSYAGSATATVNLMVYAPPVAGGDGYEIAKNTARTIAAPGVFANDTLNGATISGHSSPAHGGVTLNPDGSLTYTPNAGFSGDDSFTYTLANYAGSATATISLAVYAPPVSADDSYQVPLNTARTIAAPGIFGNDTLNGAIISGHSSPAHGTLLLSADGSFIYTPNAGYTGPDPFTYTLTNYAGSSQATVYLTVVAAPTAVADAYTAARNTPKTVAAGSGVLLNDTRNEATIAAYDQTSTHSGTVSLSADGSFTYTPPSGYIGPDAFTYTLANIAGSSIGTVSITVFGPPTAVADAYDAARNTARAVAAGAGVLGNDTLNEATITAYDHASARGGVVSLLDVGSFTYTPPTDYSGTDSFTYTLANPAGVSTATVILTVFAPPTTVNDSYVVQQNVAKSVAAPGVLVGDGVSGAALAPNTGPAHGTLTLGADGSFTYTPSVGYFGDDSFTYTLTNYAGSATGTVSLSVRIPPTAVAESYTTLAGQAIVASAPGVLLNDTGTAPLTVASHVDPLHGTLTISADGSFTYTPSAGFPALPTDPGTDSFQYTATNGTTDSTATVSLIVAMPPVAVADSYPATGGVSISVPAASGVLANDTRPTQGGATTLTGFGPTTGEEKAPGASGATASGGTVTLQSDGSFTYDPPAAPAFTGNDSFKYTLTGGLGTKSVSTVTISVPKRIYFVNAAAASNGDGRLASPFNSIAALPAAGARASGSAIFLYSGNYTGNVTLNDGDALIGQGADLSASLPFALAPNSAALPPQGATPTLAATTGNAVTIANGNTIKGLDISASGAASGVAGTSAHGGTTGLENVAISVTGAGRGLLLTTQTGAFTTSGGSITCASSGTCVDITSPSGTANADITFANTPISQTTGKLLSVNGRTGGTLTFDTGSTLTQSAGTADAITITSSTPSTTNLNAKVSVTASGASARGIYANNGGTIKVADASSFIQTTGSSAIDVSGTTTDGLNSTIDFTFERVSANGGAKGVSVRSSKGSLTVTGVGTTAGSGGTIQNTTGSGAEFVNFAPKTGASAISLKNAFYTNTAQTNGGFSCADVYNGANATCNAAIQLQNVTGVALDRIVVGGTKQFGISGGDVTNLTLTNSEVRNAGDGAGEHGIALHNLKGTATLANANVHDNREKQMYVDNDSGSLSLTISSSTFANSLYDGGLDVYARGGATVTANVSDTNFSDLYSYGVSGEADSTASGSLALNVTGGAFTSNGGAVSFQASGLGTATYSIQNINATARVDALKPGASAIIIGRPSGGANVSGTVSGNTIGSAGIAGSGANCGGLCSGIEVAGYGTTNGHLWATITNNTIQHVDGEGIAVTGGESASVVVTVTGNSIKSPDESTAGYAINVQALDLACVATTLGGTAVASAPSAVAGAPNAISGPWNDGLTQSIRLRKTTSASLSIPGSSGDIASWVSTRNGGAVALISGTPIGSATCGGLSAQGGEGPGSAGFAAPSNADLARHLSAAQSRWQSAGLSSAERAVLASATVTLADLPAGQLGEARGSAIMLDPTAAGWGWFVDPSPEDSTARVPADRVDLLTVVAHELGHVIGRADLDPAGAPTDLMAGSLGRGNRRLPAATNATGATASSSSGALSASGGDVIDLAIGTLGPGQSIVIVFDVLVNPSLPDSVRSVTNQGTISGGNVAPMLTSDPAASEPGTPTGFAVSPNTYRVYLPLAFGGLARDERPDLVVDQIRATTSSVEVVVRNRGGAPVTGEFWVDLYVAPSSAPTRVNQVWRQVASHGLVWGVTAEALPLGPGGTLTLRVGDAYYRPTLSDVAWPLAAGTPIYVQVDSANVTTTYGAVLESHEASGGAYNNISQTTVGPAGSAGATAQSEEPTTSAAHLPRRP